MKKLILTFAIAFSFSSLFISCGSSDGTEENDADQEIVDDMELTSSEADDLDGANPEANEQEIKNFLYSTEGTYGWKSTQAEWFYDFFKDGRLHIQGAEGEATMWEGKWSLEGNILTLENPDEDLVEDVTVFIDGDKILIGGVPYERYKP